ncbi:MAG: NAD(P)/FAD-dependent oxidoreductase [bacterium]
MKMAIIGGGAAGLMAAAAASETDGAEVTVLERNDAPGRKILLTGGGRCNLTTGLSDIREILARYPRGGRFLSSAMRRFPPSAVRDWFEGHGVPLKTEDDGRVFPRSDDGRDVVAVFERLLVPPRARIITAATVERVVRRTDGRFDVSVAGRPQPLSVDRTIIATGGRAYRQTGSTGDGYAFASSLGHTITRLDPSLSGLTVADGWITELSGLSFAQAKLTADSDRQLSWTGPFVFTHHGLSGPVAFALSALLAHRSFGPGNPLDLTVDLFPNLSRDELHRKLADLLKDNARHSFRNVLSELVPKRLVAVACTSLGINPDRRAAEVGRRETRQATDWLKTIPLHLSGRRAGEEFVTAGGVDLSEVNPSTMESKVCPGLFLAGEVLDIDGFTGGFNLQAAWCTGRLAGESAAS